MEPSEFIFVIFTVVLALAMAIPLGKYIGLVFDSNELGGILKPLTFLERAIYKISGIDPTRQMSWKQYASVLLIFNFLGLIFLTLLQMMQSYLPLNPEKLPGVPILLALNTAVSFVTNTNWQAYSGESTLSYLTQMLGLTVQNFLSAATGIAVLVALARSITQKELRTIGNFWSDLTKTTVHLLLPLSVLFALVLISQGVIQNFSSYLDAKGLEGLVQNLPMGPVASQVAIKQLGSNGGGYFGVNSAHPFENPTPFSNFIEILAILLIPLSLPFAFGRLLKKKKHGIAVFGTMTALFLLTLFLSLLCESQKNPSLMNLAFMEGKEIRFGIGSSILWNIATTVTSNGSVNSMLSSASPLSGALAMFNLLLGEVVFGGLGSGMYGMALFIILTVFIAGLMVGRSPEYMGKKIEAYEIKLAVLGVLIPSAVVLVFSAIAVLTDAGLSSVSNKGPHALSEILYAFASTAGNNGSAFGSLNVNTPFYNLMLSLSMLVGRYSVIIPVLAIAGSLARKKTIPPSSGTFPTDTVLFSILLACTVLVVGGLSFFPVLSLGPILEHMLMVKGLVF